MEPAAEYLKDLQAAGRAAATQRSYGMDLLRWFRFCWAIGICWEQATRAEARDFCRWMQLAGKPTRAHWRRPNQMPDSASSGQVYAPSVRAHSESVLRHFYDFHLETGSGPIVNPFPLAQRGKDRGVNAHHNPMESFRDQRSGRFRPRVPAVVPRCIPDDKFNELFAVLPSLRDRALVAFWVSTGARASELLGVHQGDVDPGQGLITVVRKGSRALQQLPASPDAFVWLRLYQAQTFGLVPAARDEPLWWTLRRPFRALTYPAARAMFTRANDVLGADWTLHSLRHTAAFRMARDPAMPLSDVQWVLGHAHLSTTGIYLSAPTQEVIASILAYHIRRAGPGGRQTAQDSATLQYRPESLDVLFRRDRP